MAHFSDEERRFRVRQMRNIIVGFIALAALIGLAIGLTAMSERQMGWVAHTYQVRRQISQMGLAVARLGAERALPGQQDRTNPGYNVGLERRRLEEAIDAFSRMTIDNPAQQARALQIRELQQQMLAPQERVPAETAHDRAKRAFTAKDLDQLVSAMQQDEDHLLTTRSARLRVLQHSFYVLLAVTATLLFVLAALIYASLWNFTQDIIVSRKALQKANHGLERAVEERTLELTRANSELRRFTYIVSHDLRAPLVNIMGFTAELETVAQRLTDILNNARRARPATIFPETDTLIEQDLPEAIHFIGASTRKMDRLINAILQLSRQNSRRLISQSLDMNTILGGIIEYLHKLIEQADATVVIAPDQPQLFCDRMVIEQIFSNLIENAVKYAQPGRKPTVRITGRRIHDFAEFRVIDNGRGIARTDHERVFDLFRRSGPQDLPGEGIGLAHVRAAVYRLGGSIRLESAPGVGSTFIVLIPVRCAQEKS